MGERRTSDGQDPVSTSTNPSRTSQGEGPYIIANGDHIVIASNGSIVSVGDNTVVKGNTGDAVASGTIAIDVDHSELASGDSTLRAAIPAALRGPGATNSPTRTVDEHGVLPRITAAAEPFSLESWQLTGGSAGAPTGRAIGIAGYENHALDIAGSDNVVTYDDSNVFLHRIGRLNGNTGDTDTSGLNVVDATGSTVRSGDSGNSDESSDPPPFNAARSGSSSASAFLARQVVARPCPWPTSTVSRLPRVRIHS